MQNRKWFLLAALTVLAFNAAAAKAPWYVWKFKVDGVVTGETVCAQSMPGTWMQFGGPFKDSKCTVPGTPH